MFQKKIHDLNDLSFNLRFFSIVVSGLSGRTQLTHCVGSCCVSDMIWAKVHVLSQVVYLYSGCGSPVFLTDLLMAYRVASTVPVVLQELLKVLIAVGNTLLIVSGVA